MATETVIGLDQVVRSLNKEISKIDGASRAGLIKGGAMFLGKAVPEAPLVTGNLRASGFLKTSTGEVTRGNNPKWKGEVSDEMEIRHKEVLGRVEPKRASLDSFSLTLGFSAVYALSVHENPRSGKTGGVSPKGRPYKPPKGSTASAFATRGGWKFLERAIKENTKKFLDIVISSVKKGI